MIHIKMFGKIKILVASLSILLSRSTHGQEKLLNFFLVQNQENNFFIDSFNLSHTVPQTKANTLDYISPFRYFASAINQKGKLNTGDLYGLYTQLGINLSFVGLTTEASRIFDSTYLLSNKPYIAKKNDSLFVSSFELKDVQRSIIEAAKRSRVVMITEAHHIPAHRIFTYSILKDLYNDGYRYLAMEALSPMAKTDPKSQVVLNYGYYLVEPEYANLVRYARNLGFSILNYDCTMNCNLPQERENIAAKNILELLNKDVSSKLIIHCGYGHAAKNKIGELEMLGSLIKSKGHITPVSIAQHLICEGSGLTYKSFVYNFLSLKEQINTPKTIFFHNEMFDFSGDSSFDFTVLTPRVNDFDKTYLKENTNLEYMYFNIPYKQNDEAYLIQLFPRSEIATQDDYEKVVPALNLMVLGEKSEMRGLVPRGQYYCIIRDANNKQIFRKKINTKRKQIIKINKRFE